MDPIGALPLQDDGFLSHCHAGLVPASAYTVLIADTKQAPEWFGRLTNLSLG